MSWSPRTTNSGLEYGGIAHNYYWNPAYNPDARYSSCLADCTCLAYGRCLEEGCRGPVPYTANWSLPAANSWHSRLTNDWTYDSFSSYRSSIKPGDIIEWVSGWHVAVVESVVGSTIYCSSSLYTGDHGRAFWPVNSTNYDTRTPGVMGSTMQDVSNWMLANYSWRFYEYVTVDTISNVRLGVQPDYVLINPDSGGGPTPPPTPVENLTISIMPASYTVTMQYDEDSVDFTYAITISGIPGGETVSGGNTYPGLDRVANTGWSYTDYTVNGITYRRAYKQQTLRYFREYNIDYTTVKHMYYNITKSTGTISTDTPMYITVKAKGIPPQLRGYLAAKRRKRGRINGTWYIN